MLPEFKTTIEELYKTFSKYPLKPTMEGCPCCVSDSDKSTLHSKQLRALESDDISRYAFKAMTTWGDQNDFKHYLPRILELSSSRKLMVITSVVLGKLEYGKWQHWDQSEKDTIVSFLKAWWNNEINQNDYFDAEILIEINKLLKDLPHMLDVWALNSETQEFKNYVDLIEQYYPDLKHKNKVFRSFNPEELEVFISWIESNAYRLEAGFFKYETTDKAFSEHISNALYLLEGFK